MGADFSKFQGVLMFELQILLTYIFKGFKMQMITESRHQKQKNEQSGTTVCSLASAALEFQEIFVVKTKLTTYNLTSSTTYQIFGGGRVYEKL
jgi:hypothetical protein